MPEVGEICPVATDYMKKVEVILNEATENGIEVALDVLAGILIRNSIRIGCGKKEFIKSLSTAYDLYQEMFVAFTSKTPTSVN